MAAPRFKLDLVSFDDPATLLRLPVSAEPASVTLQLHGGEEEDARLAQDLQLIEQLDAVLTTTDISFVRPINTDVVSNPNPSCRLAKSLVSRNPLLFQYGVADMEDVVAATPGRSAPMAVSAHNSQLDPPGTASVRKASSGAPVRDHEERGVDVDAPTTSKKRARRGVKQETYVMSHHEAEAAAAKLESFLEAAMVEASNRGRDGDAENDVSGIRGGSHGHGQQRWSFPYGVLKDMHGHLLTAQAQGYLHLVPQTRLQGLLLALNSTAAMAHEQLLPEDAEAKFASVTRVTTGLEAVLCELVILSTPQLPPSLYLEEVLGTAVELTKYHLQYNILAVHDARFKHMYRPAEGDDDDDAAVKPVKPPRGRGAGAAVAGKRLPRWTEVLVGQLEQALTLLAHVLGLVRMAVEGLIPLVRMSQQTLTVASLNTLHYRALGLVVSMFKFYPQQRNTVVDEFVQGVLTHLNPGKHLARHFPLQTADKPTNIQMVTALVMELIQVTAELPPLDGTGPAALEPARLPIRWSDYFWHEIFKKLPAARATKADTSADMKAWVEALVEDLLAAVPLPEWPAASVLLRRLAIVSKENMRNPDAGVQVVCIELLGLLARQLHILVREAGTPEAVRAVTLAVDGAIAAAGKEASETATDKGELAQELLLEHLAAPGSVGHDGSGGSGGAGLAATSISGSARQFIACNMLLAREKALSQQQQGQKLDEQQTSEAIMYYRQVYERQRSSLGTSTSGLAQVDRETAIALGRWLASESLLVRSRRTLLCWLADAGGSGRTRQEAHAAAARAKAIKLLGAVIEVDVGVLSCAEVQVGIKAALEDDSVLVREAAVDLIGKHISRSAELAVQFYDVLVRAVEDSGLTVRKRAIRLLWECCVRFPDFTHRTDALLRIASRATDPEDTMRTLVNKICAEIWFLSGFQIDGDDGTTHVSRSSSQRAAQLGEVVMAIYSRMGSAISVPFHSAMPIVTTIRSIVGEEGKPELAAVRRGAREVADMLLARALELQGEQDAPTQSGTSGRQEGPAAADELFQCLLALHALCVADVKLLHQPEDPQRVVRCLAPYIKEIPMGANDHSCRRKAEQLLAVLAVVGGCMGALRHMDDVLADEIVQDLQNIIRRVSHVQVVTVACQCLCAMAGLKPPHRNTVRLEASTYFNILENDYRKQVTSLPEKQRMYPRLLYILGTLCRYGSDILDETIEGSKHPTCAAALDLVLRFYTLLADNNRAKETALQALGFIFIARPQLAVNVREVGPVLEAALDRSAPASLKARCLSSLTELLRSEEDVLTTRQAAARREAAASQQASTLPDAEHQPLARRNGEGDNSSVSSGIVQMLWDKILALATDATPAPVSTAASGSTPPPTPSGTAAAHGAVVRRRALELIEVVIRGGIVVPWTAMPALCALATDPERDTAERALAGLRGVVAANTAFVAGQVPGGVAEAYAFHCKLAALERPGQAPAPDKCRTLVEGLSVVWSSIFQPDRALKAKFLTALLKPLDDGCTLASGLAAKSDPHLLSFMTYIIAELPYRKMDELLAVLVRINEIVSRRGEDVLARFQELREAGRSARAPPGANVLGANGPTANGADTNTAPGLSPMPSGRSTGSGSHGANILVGLVKASLTLSLALLLKQYLRMSYDVSAERVAKYDPTGPQRKVEEKLSAVHNGKLRFNASKLRIDVAARVSAQPLGAVVAAGASKASKATAASLAGAASAHASASASVLAAMDPDVDEVYKVLKTLMKQDEQDYKAAAGTEPEAEAVGSPPGGGDLRDVTMNLEEIMAAPDVAVGASRKPPTGSRGRARGGRGRASPHTGEPPASGRGRGRGRGRDKPSSSARASTVGRRGGGKRKRIASDTDDSDDDGEDGNDNGAAGGADSDGAEEEDARYKPRATKRRPSKVL